MGILKLKPEHKAVKDYYAALEQFEKLNVDSETAVRSAFQNLLEVCGKQRHWTVVAGWEIKRQKQHPVFVDAALVDDFKLPHGFWEAKDSKDDLAKEVQKKFKAGYPQDNILFQSPKEAILYQDRQLVLEANLTKPDQLIDALNAFFAHTPPEYEQWEKAVDEFQQRVPELGRGLKEIIDTERKTNQRFVTEFTQFADLCRASLNPNLRDEAVEEMLIQHLLTERLFRTVFKNPDFVKRNVIANQIEQVIDALASKSFSRAEFLQKLDRFYRAIEDAAATITDFSHKQKFLNTVYEKFFQGFCVKVADTHGIVYTPPSIVRFMIASVEHLLKEHFGKTLADSNVHILDPFVGTGNFLVHLMREIPKSQLRYKYLNELWSNEIMLFPYYICCMNIEHEYYEATGEYEPFPGACLVDTFELAEPEQMKLNIFSEENTQRVKRQKDAPIFVIISNPPYNAWQANENDNNKNRRYPVVDKWVAETYAADSKATNKNSLSDPYVKAIRWASNRIGDEGIVAFVSNNGFIDGIACDGMRKHLAEGFDFIYVLDLKGNVRKNTKISGTTHNVFGIQVGVSINLLVRSGKAQHPARIFYLSTDEFWRKEDRYRFLDERQQLDKVAWQLLAPDKRHNWLTEGMSEAFLSFLPLAGKPDEGKTVFRLTTNGLKSNRDAWVWNFSRESLTENVTRLTDAYNEHVLRWQHRANKDEAADDFVTYDGTRIAWTRELKTHMQRGRMAVFSNEKIRQGLSRPFTKQWLFFDRILNEVVYRLPSVFPTAAVEEENRTIWLKVGAAVPMYAVAAQHIPAALPYGGAQCFSFYTYSEDGSDRRENITDWALEQFRQQYQSQIANPKSQISKWDVFHYVYAVLHHPEYRERYAANLRRELPRIPFAPDFRVFAEAGKKLADLHVNYEQQPEYPLQRIENSDERLNWRVEKMRLSNEKTSLTYNDFLTLAGIPKETFDYRLGNRSALELVIDQYQVKTDARSGITNAPNRADDPEYIVRLVGQVITVSLETEKIVGELSSFSISG